MQCLAEEGFAGTGVRAIAQRAGVSIGLIRHHFEEKNQLIAATYRHVSDQLHTASEEAVAEAGSEPWQCLHAFLMAGFYPPLLERRYVLVRFVLWSAALTEPAIRVVHDEVRARYRDRLRELIAEAAGHAKTDAQIVAMTGTVLALLDGMWVDWILDEPGFNPEAAVSNAVAMLRAEAWP